MRDHRQREENGGRRAAAPAHGPDGGAGTRRGADGGGNGNGDDSLPFTVELIDATAGERILARAANASLARAIFVAARSEYPNARVLLKRGSETVLDSASAG